VAALAVMNSPVQTNYGSSFLNFSTQSG